MNGSVMLLLTLLSCRDGHDRGDDGGEDASTGDGAQYGDYEGDAMRLWAVVVAPATLGVMESLARSARGPPADGSQTPMA